MRAQIQTILLLIGFIAGGVWCFLAGMYGWKYPRLKWERGDDHEKLINQFFKIVFGTAFVILGIWGLIEEIFFGGLF